MVARAFEQTTDHRFHPDLIRAPVIRKTYGYWLKKAGDRDMPQVGDIDILDLGFAVGAVSYIDVVDKTPRFWMRMIGSMIVDHYGIDNTGLYVEEIADPDSSKMLQSSYTLCFERREPFWIERKMVAGERLYLYECLILPLCGESGEVERLMSILYWPEESSNMPWTS